MIDITVFIVTLLKDLFLLLWGVAYFLFHHNWGFLFCPILDYMRSLDFKYFSFLLFMWIYLGLGWCEFLRISEFFFLLESTWFSVFI